MSDEHTATHGMGGSDHGDPDEVAGSLKLRGAVALGTGVMIGAGIFALPGQVAEVSGDLFPIAFLVAAVVVAFSSYSYVKLSSLYSSSGGVAMYLKAEYGLGTATGFFSLLMYLSMVMSESLVARTFGSYTLQVVDLGDESFWVPALGVALLVVAFGVNVAGNRLVEATEGAMALIKIAGLGIFAVGALWFAETANFTNGTETGGSSATISGFLAGIALSILAYKGFTTITNSGGEIVNPERNVGKAIVISIAICSVLYVAIALAIAGNLTLSEVVDAADFALARAAEPAFGEAGVWLTVALAIIATTSGVIASVFAASRMLAMLTRMSEVPHRHFGLPGSLRKHAMVYTVSVAIVATVFLDLGRIAALGAIFYLIMDIAIHWGLLRHLRDKVNISPAIVATAIVLDIVVLIALLWVKGSEDVLILYVSAISLVAILVAEELFMRSHTDADGNMNM
ncbi:MAG: APC family permease [Acidimicrobiales bacterium]